MAAAIRTTSLPDRPDIPRRQGKVRDLYELGDRLALVATDRLSAFDWVLETAIPGKGVILTQLSNYWFARLGVPHHLLATELADIGPPFSDRPEVFAGRTVLATRTRVVPFECVARGHLAGSGWLEYQRTGMVCGVPLPPGLRQADRLPEPIFTPATKATAGHDENVTFAAMADAIGADLAGRLRATTLAIFAQAADHAAARGVILADTKLEFGLAPSGELLLIDEVLTPDSSRFWPADAWRPGMSPPSFDKQYVRDYLESVGYDKAGPPPPLPEEVVARTAERYAEALRRLTA